MAHVISRIIFRLTFTVLITKYQLNFVLLPTINSMGNYLMTSEISSLLLEINFINPGASYNNNGL
jgi:hypothetical protein